MSQSTPNNKILLTCIGLLALSLVGFGTTRVLQPLNDNMYAPSIAVVMSGETKSFIGSTPGCEEVEYQIYIWNNSTNNESLTNIKIVDDSDPEFGNDLGFKGGDDNNNGVLDPDETWLFNTTISLNQDDFDAGQASNQARVTADVVGQPGISVSDLSDDNEYKEDEPTITPILCDSGIALKMTTETKGPLGENGGCTSVEYTITVAHQGSAVQIFDFVEVFMENGDPVPGPDSGDGGTLGHLESGEEWIYTTTYPITASDINAGQVIRNSFVTSEINDGGLKTASDISDFENYTEDRPTITDVSFCQPQIALLKTGQVANDCGSIDYEFAVLNLSGNGQTFQNVNITDGSLVIDDPTGDANNDGLLDTNETWTYKASYDLTADDINLGHVDNLATVTADVTGYPGLTALDDSHPTELNSDGPTTTDVSSCQPAISILKTGTVDTDCLNIDYNFSVANEGGSPLTSVVVTDAKVPVPLLPNSGDDNDNSLLDPNEIWIYSASYSITQDDIINETVSNIAQVDAEVDGLPALTVTDQSHPDNTLLDGDTVTDISSCKPAIAIVKTGTLDETCSDIEYKFEVTNQGAYDLKDVEVADLSLGLTVENPSGDDDNDQELDVGEIWTYVASYNIQQNDFDLGWVSNSARVDANVVDFLGLAVSDLSHPSDVTLDDPTITTLASCVPNISIIKTGTVSADCLTIDYTFIVENQGNQVLEAVAVTDPLLTIPALPDSGDDNNNSLLDLNEIWTYTATYPITAEDFNKGMVENQAEVNAHVIGLPAVTVNDQSDDDSVFEDDKTVTDLSNCVPNISILKTGTVSADCLTIDYTFIVENQGNQVLEAVAVTDPLLTIPALPDSGDDNNNGLLDLNEEWTYTANYPLTATDFNNGQVQNQAQADAQVLGLPALTVTDLSDDDSVDQNDPTVTDLSGCVPNISIIKTGAVTADCLSIDYTFTVANQGNQDLTVDEVKDNDHPALNITLMGGDIDLDGVLDLDEIWTYTASYPLTATDFQDGMVENQAEVNAHVVGLPALTVTDLSDDDSVFEDDKTVTDLSNCVPNISILKTGTVSADCLTIDYTFIVENQGNQVLEAVAVTDPLLTIPALPDSGDDNNNGLLDLNEIWTYTATYPITAEDFNKGMVENQAEVNAHVIGLPAVTVNDQSDDDSVFENDKTVTDLSGCQNLKIGLIKEASLADLDQNGCNESVFYRFTVANTGNVSLSNLVLEDELLFNGIVAGPVNGSDDGNDGILSPNETWIYEAYYGITAQDLANGDVINQAKITGWTQDNIQVTDDSDANSYDENDATLISVIESCENSAPRIGLIKLGYLSDPDGDECPEAINYTFKVSNRGGEPLANVTISDTFLGTGSTFTLESGDDNGNNSLDLGEEWVYTSSYILTKTDIEAGKVENQAEVTAQSTITQQTVMDISDNNSYEENDPTSTEVIDACDPEGPDTNPINEDFEIYTGITPNGDGINDFFRINGIEHYPDNVLKIFNRWGVLVYEAEGYGIGNKLFSGVSEGRATVSQQETLPSGTYFYTLKFENLNPGQETYSGYLYINRD